MNVSKCHVCAELDPQLIDARCHFGLEKSGFQNTLLHCGKDACVNFAKKALINNFAQSGKYLYDKDNAILKKEIFICIGKYQCVGKVICYDNNSKSMIVLNNSDSLGKPVGAHVSVPISEICCSAGFGDTWGTLADFTYMDFMPLFPENMTKENKEEIIGNLKYGVNSVSINESAPITKVDVTIPRSSGAIDNDWKVVRYVKSHMQSFYRHMTLNEQMDYAERARRRNGNDYMDFDQYHPGYQPPSIFCRKQNDPNMTTKALPINLFIKHNPGIKVTDFKSSEVTDGDTKSETIGEGYSYADFEHEFNRGVRVNAKEENKQKQEEQTKKTKAVANISQPSQQCCIVS